MRVLVTGATGFIGRAASLRLQRDGHRVLAWVRDPARARGLLGADVELVPEEPGDTALRQALATADAVINLAGAPVLPHRWTSVRKRILWQSRVGVTERLVAAVAKERPPKVFVSSSAIGYYGDTGDREVDEASASGRGLLAELCQAWEAAAAPVRELGVRLVTLRTGLVIGPEGGLLAPLLLPFSLGLGGTLGRGRQWMSWIHRDDLVEIIARALTDESFNGPINGVAPNPVRNAEFTKTLASALGRPAVLPVPAPLLRLGLGEAASAMLASQRVQAKALRERGFSFGFASLAAAIDDVLAGPGSVCIASVKQVPDSDYLRARRPTHVLTQRTVLFSPRSDVASFFSRAANLGAVTPPFLGFSFAVPPPAEVHAGTVLEHLVRVGPLKFRWRTVLERWELDDFFVDAQHRGPYRAWWHEHRFMAEGDSTIMEDTVYYAVPFGFLGRIVHRLFVARTLRRIFGFRAAVIRLRFGGPALAASSSAWYLGAHERGASAVPEGAASDVPSE